MPARAHSHFYVLFAILLPSAPPVAILPAGLRLYFTGELDVFGGEQERLYRCHHMYSVISPGWL